jgi:hypothetical protein
MRPLTIDEQLTDLTYQYYAGVLTKDEYAVKTARIKAQREQDNAYNG